MQVKPLVENRERETEDKQQQQQATKQG